MKRRYRKTLHRLEALIIRYAEENISLYDQLLDERRKFNEAKLEKSRMESEIAELKKR